jgi:hypothetical protein
MGDPVGFWLVIALTVLAVVPITFGLALLAMFLYVRWKKLLPAKLR